MWPYFKHRTMCGGNVCGRIYACNKNARSRRVCERTCAPLWYVLFFKRTQKKKQPFASMFARCYFDRAKGGHLKMAPEKNANGNEKPNNRSWQDLIDRPGLLRERERSSCNGSEIVPGRYVYPTELGHLALGSVASLGRGIRFHIVFYTTGHHKSAAVPRLCWQKELAGMQKHPVCFCVVVPVFARVWSKISSDHRRAGVGLIVETGSQL